MKKNILKSILVTNFVVMIFVVLFEYVTTSILLNYTDYSDEGTRYTYIEIGKGFEESLQNLSGDDRYFQEGVILNALSNVSTLSTTRLLSYAIILSIIIGAGIGYLITVVDGSPKRSFVIKKVIVAYFIGMLLAPSLTALLGYIEYGIIDPPEMLISIIVWTVVFILTLLVKKAIDNKKARNLKNLFELAKKHEK